MFVEALDGDFHYYFGTAVPALGKKTITIPEVFEDHPNVTLVLRYKDELHDEMGVTVNVPVESGGGE